MRTDDREVKMTGDDGKMTAPIAYEVETPENYAEAVEMFGESGAFSIFISGLKVKQDNIARNSFRAQLKENSNAEIEDMRPIAEKAVSEWRPGGVRISKKSTAYQMLISNIVRMEADADLKRNVETAFVKNDFDKVIELLS